MQCVCEFEAIENRNQYIVYNYFSPAALAFPPSLPYSINIFFTAPSALSVTQTMIDITQCEFGPNERINNNYSLLLSLTSSYCLCMFLVYTLASTQPLLLGGVAADAVVLVDGSAFWGIEDPPAVDAFVVVGLRGLDALHGQGDGVDERCQRRDVGGDGRGH